MTPMFMFFTQNNEFFQLLQSKTKSPCKPYNYAVYKGIQQMDLKGFEPSASALRTQRKNGTNPPFYVILQKP